MANIAGMVAAQYEDEQLTETEHTMSFSDTKVSVTETISPTARPHWTKRDAFWLRVFSSFSALGLFYAAFLVLHGR